MSDEKDLGRELLKENGIEPGSLPEDRRKELRKMIERDKARARGAKFGAVGGPLFVLVIVLVIKIVRTMLGYEGGLVDVMSLLFLGLFSLVFIIVSLYFIGMYFGQRQIQTSLTDITEQLKQLAKNQQANPPR